MEITSRLVRYNPELVEKAGLPEETQELLIRSGLPQFTLEGEPVLGIRFNPVLDCGLIRTSDDSKMLLPIGYEWDEKTAALGLESGTGILYRVDVQTKEHAVINSSLHLFLAFLSRYAAIVKEHSKPDEPSVMTLEQAQAKLEAFRRGEIKPRSQVNEQPKKDEAVKQLRLFYTEKDPVSMLDEETWWSVVLEQLEDELL
ncbi:SUKH-4 family immunity protein [Paenibacillus silvae]|uniref:SUKH-4 family immunity protein n=1 Tax=Paenibacillus TaxID=44249 RepID=UPI001C1266E8|nr:SUKH-4 family immunity protein [Paenibacillus silvae]MBU5355322.1 SUKH-4 family immunity protein [Paenibacillus barcinonensis]MDM5281266.1 SUKH-4 family immunity protein [Paenibacillus silvae]